MAVPENKFVILLMCNIINDAQDVHLGPVADVLL